MIQGVQLQPVNIKPLGKKMTVVKFFLCVDHIHSDYISHQPPRLLDILPNQPEAIFWLACP